MPDTITFSLTSALGVVGGFVAVLSTAVAAAWRVSQSQSDHWKAAYDRTKSLYDEAKANPTKLAEEHFQMSSDFIKNRIHLLQERNDQLEKELLISNDQIRKLSTIEITPHNDFAINKSIDFNQTEIRLMEDKIRIYETIIQKLIPKKEIIDEILNGLRSKQLSIEILSEEAEAEDEKILLISPGEPRSLIEHRIAD